MQAKEIIAWVKIYNSHWLPSECSDEITTLIIYVDDMVSMENDLKERKSLLDYLVIEFEMKDLGL